MACDYKPPEIYNVKMLLKKYYAMQSSNDIAHSQ